MSSKVINAQEGQPDVVVFGYPPAVVATIDNYSGSTVFIPQAGRYIPPWRAGVVVRIDSPAPLCQVQWAVPTGQPLNPVPSGGRASVTFSSESIPETAGTAIYQPGAAPAKYPTDSRWSTSGATNLNSSAAIKGCLLLGWEFTVEYDTGGGFYTVALTSGFQGEFVVMGQGAVPPVAGKITIVTMLANPRPMDEIFGADAIQHSSPFVVLLSDLTVHADLPSGGAGSIAAGIVHILSPLPDTASFS